jgi:hypothetical protein
VTDEKLGCRNECSVCTSKELPCLILEQTEETMFRGSLNLTRDDWLTIALLEDQESSDSETYLHKMLHYGGQFERQGLSNIDLRFLVRCWVFSFRGCGGTNGWMCRVGGRRRLYVVQRRCDYRVQRGGLHKHRRRFIG